MAIQNRGPELCRHIRALNPLIHHITNTVTINDCANMTLALGASPVMADSPDEAAEMAKLAQALVLNIGTLHRETIEAMVAAGSAANEAGIPVVFDPVGAGATPFRLQACRDILQHVRPAVIRGNMSEIKALAGLKANAKGVDSGDDMENAAAVGTRVAEETGAVVAVTGPVDVITDGRRVVHIFNGHPMMAKVTGTGCVSNSLIAGFLAVTPDALEAAGAGLTLMGLAGERGVARLTEGEGTGTLRVRLIDAVYELSHAEEWKGANWHERRVED